jgi:hypothetical protein
MVARVDSVVSSLRRLLYGTLHPFLELTNSSLKHPESVCCIDDVCHGDEIEAAIHRRLEMFGRMAIAKRGWVTVNCGQSTYM